MRFVLITCMLVYLFTGMYAQSSSVEYAVSRQPIAAIVLPDNEAPILYQGGFEAADNGFFPPVQLDLNQAVPSLVPLTQSGFTASSTLASWFDESTGKQYVLESDYECDMVEVPTRLNVFDPNDPSQVQIIPTPDLFVSDNPETGLVVNGDLYLILRDDYVLAGNLSAPNDVIRHDLAIGLPKTGMQRFATRGDGSIQMADANAVYTFTSTDAPTFQTFQQDILGLSVSANDALIVYTTTFVYVVDTAGQVNSISHNSVGNSFTSFASAPQHGAFVCTYFSPSRDEFIATGRFENGVLTLVQTGEIDPSNRAFCMKFSAQGDRQLGVVGYYNHNTKLVVYSENGDLEIGNSISVTLTMAEVEADVSVVNAGDTSVARITYIPVVTNTSSTVIERLDFDASKLDPWFCRSSSGLFYENLGLQPGESRQLAPITIFGFDYLPAPSAEVTLQLNAANNLPITPGVPRTYTKNPLLVNTSSAFAKTMEVYPNPASDVLSVDASALGPLKEVIVSDVLGRQYAVQFSDKQLDISMLPVGQYALLLFDVHGDAARSVFIKR